MPPSGPPGSPLRSFVAGPLHRLVPRWLNRGSRPLQWRINHPNTAQINGIEEGHGGMAIWTL